MGPEWLSPLFVIPMALKKKRGGGVWSSSPGEVCQGKETILFHLRLTSVHSTSYSLTAPSGIMNNASLLNLICFQQTLQSHVGQFQMEPKRCILQQSLCLQLVPCYQLLKEVEPFP